MPVHALAAYPHTRLSRDPNHCQPPRLLRHRSPTMLRHSCTLLIFIGTAFLAPYFVHVGVCDSAPDTWASAHCPGAYAACITYVVISMLLLNVQVRGSWQWARGRGGVQGRAAAGWMTSPSKIASCSSASSVRTRIGFIAIG